MEHFACKDVFDAARSGDAFAAETLEQVFDYLGEALADACCVCDPERIILGGGVSRAGDYLLQGVERHFRAHMFHACRTRSSRWLRSATTPGCTVRSVCWPDFSA